jgi:hypothetical protein
VRLVRGKIAPAARAELAGLLEQFAREIVAARPLAAEPLGEALQKGFLLRSRQHPDGLFNFSERAHGRK